MDSNGIWALLGAIIVAFLIRLFNIVSEWLATILGVDVPEPIPSIQHAKAQAKGRSVDQDGLGAVPSPPDTEAPSSAAPEHPEAPSAPS